MSPLLFTDSDSAIIGSVYRYYTDVHTASESSCARGILGDGGPVGEGGSDLGGVEGGEGNKVAWAWVGEGRACGKKMTGCTGETGEGEHNTAGDTSLVGAASVGGAIV